MYKKYLNVALRILLISGLLISQFGCGQGPVGSTGSAGQTGSKGDTGNSGVNGNNGANGTDGVNGSNGLTIQSGLQCSAVDSGSGVLLLYFYESVLYSTGDRFVTCSISTDLNEYSSSDLYVSTQNGAVSGGCTVTYDINVPNGGFWTFTSQNSVTKTAYTDPGTGTNGYSFTFNAGSCTNF